LTEEFSIKKIPLRSVLVTVVAFGLWQMILGSKTRQVKTNGSTIRDLIDTLDDLSMGKLANEVLADEALDPKFKIFVNGHVSDSLSTKLTDGDEVLLFSVIDGG